MKYEVPQVEKDRLRTLEGEPVEVRVAGLK
jgi:hypothetical protein